MAETFAPADHDALLVVDVQNDFCPGGALAVPEGDAVVPVINRLARRFPHVILTQDWHPAGHHSFASAHPEGEPFATVQAPYGPQILWPDHCVQGSTGAAFHPELETDRAELVVRKGFRPHIDSYSAFYENDHRTATGLAGFLRERGLGRLFVVGLATDFCVRDTAVDGAAAGFEVLVVADGCRGIDIEGSVEQARHAMTAAGVRQIAAESLVLPPEGP